MSEISKHSKIRKISILQIWYTYLSSIHNKIDFSSVENSVFIENWLFSRNRRFEDCSGPINSKKLISSSLFSVLSPPKVATIAMIVEKWSFYFHCRIKLHFSLTPTLYKGGIAPPCPPRVATPLVNSFSIDMFVSASAS